METVLPPPSPFCFNNNVENSTSGNVSKEWEKWKTAFLIYFEACELTKKTQKVQMNIFLHIVGEQCREIYDQFTEEFIDLKSLIEKFDGVFLQRKNITVQRHAFFIREQNDGESVEQFSLELKRLAVKCEFEGLCDDLVRDRLICGIKDGSLRERLLREPKLTLQKAVEICNIAQLSRVQAGNIKKDSVKHCAYCVSRTNSAKSDNVEDETSNQVHWVSRQRRGQQHRGASGLRSRQGAGRGTSSYSPQHSPKASTSRGYAGNANQRAQRRSCRSCGMDHIGYKCPPIGKRCLKCNNLNHFSRVCKVYEVQRDGDESNDQVIYYVNHSSSDWCVKLAINNKEVSFKIDTGADVNVLPYNYLETLKIPKDYLIPTNIKLRGYSGSDITVVGSCNLKVKYKELDYIIDFLIADVTSPPILGRDSCRELSLIKLTLSVTSSENSSEYKNSIFAEYKDVFEGVGCMPGDYKISIDNGIRPVVHAPRKLPVSLKESLKLKLDEMEKQKIIARVEGPTDWVNSMTVVRKPNGDLRICLDPRDLNRAIKREHFQLPTLDEITVNFIGARYFSTVDARNGFWQLRLHKDSTDLCTFNTAFGRYKFLRLPYGITSASEVFHKKMYEHFDDIEGTCLFVDDLIIYGRNKQEHDQRLKKVLDRCRAINLKLNKSKCKLGLTEIKYLGHKITNKGIYPDESHVTAIKNMPSPENTKDLERFLGLINYVGRFIPNLSEKTNTLRLLLKKEVEWHWTPEHQNAFSKLKQCLTNKPVLQYFDPCKPVVISVDASKCGLGACLLQSNLPVSYASRSLTKAEQNYAQIEKELLACVFACEKFYTYIYGKSDVVVETDHKPLVNIINKPIASAPARLQRMLLRLQLYSFNLVYKPGKYLYIADTLSRAAEPVSYRSVDLRDHFDAKAQVCAVTACNILMDTHFVQLQKYTYLDGELQQLMKCIQQGWPEHKQQLNDELKPYWSHRHDLSVLHDLVWKDNCIVIPKSMRYEMLKNIHVGHLGLEKCKLRMRETMFWPNINSQLEDYISKCQACVTHKNENRKETLISHDIPNRPWCKIATDTFHFNNGLFLLVVDYYSKFIECVKLKSLTSNEVISKLQNIFSRQGIPNIVVSDNGPEYNSNQFKIFSKDWKFNHVTSSPRYPQSNGQAERSVQIVKNIMKKTMFDNSDYRLGLLEYSNTPLGSTLASPAELLYSRKLRSLVPCSPKLLKPKVQTNVRSELNNRQSKQARYYNKGAKDMIPLKVGQRIKVRVNKKWISGVVAAFVGIRSYSIDLDHGGSLIRNRRHLIVDTAYSPTADRSRPLLNYDDITVPENREDSPSRSHSQTSNLYTTRFGRTVREPDRWTYPSS